MLSKIVLSLTKFFKGLFYSIKNRKRFWANDELKQKRLDICTGTNGNLSCDSLLEENYHIFKTRRCGECGCYIKQKVKFTFEQCPSKKW